MRSLTRSLYQAAGLALLLALFPAFVIFFRVVVIRLPFDLPPAAAHDWSAFFEYLNQIVINDTAMPFACAISLLYPHRRGLESQDGRAGLFAVFVVSMLVGAMFAAAGHGSTELSASIPSAGVFGGLGTLVLKNAAREGADPKTPRVLSGAKTASYEQIKRREYREPES